MNKSDNTGGKIGMFFLAFLAILPKLIRFVVIPVIIMFFIYSFLKSHNITLDRIIGKLGSAVEQTFGTEGQTEEK